MKESKVESCIRRHLASRGCVRISKAKRPSEHGIDIKAYDPKICRTILIEVKGGSKYPHQAFYTLIGQLLSRMDEDKYLIYAFGIPCSWATIFRKKALKMRYGWSFLKPKVYLVKRNGQVLEYSYSYFLKGSEVTKRRSK